MNTLENHSTEVTVEMARELEFVEAQMWKTLFTSIPVTDAMDLGVRYESLGAAMCFMFEKLPVWMFNRVLGLGIDSPASLSDIQYLMDFYGNKRLPLGISLSPFAQPANLVEELDKLGFVNQIDWAKMVRGTEPPPAIKTDLRLEKAGPEHHEQALDVLMQGFGMPNHTRPAFAAALKAPCNTTYIMWDKDQPAAVAMLSIFGQTGHLNTACTLPQYRNRGAQGALMAQRIRDGIERGCNMFVTETGIVPNEKNPSLQNMIRCGFKLAYARPNYVLQNA